MAYHTECYSAVMGRESARKFPAKYASRCQNQNCPKGGTIQAGQLLSWVTRGKSAAPRTSVEIAGNTGAVEHYEDEVETGEEEEMPKANNDLAAIIGAAVQGYIKPSLDKEAIETLVLDTISALGLDQTPKRVEIKLSDMTTIDAGVQHKMFPLLVQLMSAQVNVWIAGPAGSGKTFAVHAAANALKMAYRYSGAVNDPVAFLGYQDATGNYISTQFREAYEHGGVFLLDEVDGCSPDALLALNAALANGSAAFPDRMVERHPECIIVATANTWGYGATNEYVGRARQDAASLDRFVCLEWVYDEDLERSTCGNTEWAKRVQEVRKRAADKKLRVLVTPRATYTGAKLLSAGISQEEVERIVLRKGMTEDQWDSIAA